MSGKPSVYKDYGRLPLPEESRVVPWFAIGGDESLRIDYTLNKDSVVYDIGGYKGDWAEVIYDRYKCRIEVFEPVKQFVKILHDRFPENKKIAIHEFGLGGKTRKVKISLEEASSSVFKAKDNIELIQLRAAHEVISKTEKINLMKMNIEAGEYELLDDLIDSGIIKNITDIQIQFHVFIDSYEKRRKELQERLSQTHYMTYNYRFIWENWRKK